MSNNTKDFHFKYEGPDCSDVADEFPIYTSITKNIELAEHVTWDIVLNEFLLFLGHCYGYDIKSQVEYKNFSGRLEQLHAEGKISDEDWEEVKGW
jgi:hypothetical protein